MGVGSWGPLGEPGQLEGQTLVGLVVDEQGVGAHVGHVDHPQLAVGAHDHAVLQVGPETDGLAVLERDEHLGPVVAWR